MTLMDYSAATAKGAKVGITAHDYQSLDIDMFFRMTVAESVYGRRQEVPPRHHGISGHIT
ncbi:hypothetical protein ACLOAV_008396 [Pseudogymnoascus australis]